MNIVFDVHTHILPEMDDGSKSVSESIEMLTEEKRQGVQTVALTPHYYAFENSPQEFLQRRDTAWEKLKADLNDDFPEILLGAEVQYFEGISRVEEISQLCIGNTGLLLLEMPFSRWSERVIQEVLSLNCRGDVKIILAHIDRYFSLQPKDIWKRLSMSGIFMQLNAGVFLNWKTRRKAMPLLKSGMIQFIGSDCHNMGDRPPDIMQADKFLENYANALFKL